MSPFQVMLVEAVQKQFEEEQKKIKSLSPPLKSRNAKRHLLGVGTAPNMDRRSGIGNRQLLEQKWNIAIHSPGKDQIIHRRRNLANGPK